MSGEARVFHLRTPISDEDVEKLRVGDIIYITGIMVTARDEAHKKILEVLERGEKLPIDLRGLVLYHCGPVVRKRPDGTWEVVAAGPTTSMRMESVEAEFIAKTGVKVIVGKGGMGRRTAEAMKKYKAVYAVFTGGAGALAANRIKRVVDVYWLEELGIPEAVWVFEVEEFGPLVVTIDSHGNNYYEKHMEEVRKRAEEIKKELLSKIEH
ncbi:MAG: FumA C-terminus/TtdB family hydratase beta subunit [Desulfurococcales archaeon]|nr:FumA C-terminus/TtdB family hydratase beta subunit [Desulfurococcales archaeon]